MKVMEDSNLNNLEREILNELQTFFNQDTDNDSPGYWTKGVKDVFYKIGKRTNNSILVAGSCDSFDCREWLYDLVWWTEEKKDGICYLKSIELMMECEWCQDFYEIQYDFEKLLVGRSRLKVMVCHTANDKTHEWFDYFKNAISLYQDSQQKERYLILIYDEKTGVFNYKILATVD